MFSRIHNKIGTAGLVVSIVALVAALCGAAFAAGGLTKQQENRVKQLVKQSSKPGPQGPAGPQGAQGPQGSAGASGTTGSIGPEGKQGPTGATGKNGTNGENGEDGMCSVGKPECILPPRTTLTGTWAAASAGEFHESYFSISYPLRVIPQPVARYIKPKGSPTSECPGSYLQPKAEPGYVCLYATTVEQSGEVSSEPLYGFTETDQTSGLVARFESKLSEGGPRAFGSWAVTAHCTQEEEETEVEDKKDLGCGQL